jgi:hypothetical protein
MKLQPADRPDLVKIASKYFILNYFKHVYLCTKTELSDQKKKEIFYYFSLLGLGGLSTLFSSTLAGSVRFRFRVYTNNWWAEAGKSTWEYIIINWVTQSYYGSLVGMGLSISVVC